MSGTRVGLGLLLDPLSQIAGTAVRSQAYGAIRSPQHKVRNRFDDRRNPHESAGACIRYWGNSFVLTDSSDWVTESMACSRLKITPGGQVELEIIRVGEFTIIWRYNSTEEIKFVSKACFRF